MNSGNFNTMKKLILLTLFALATIGTLQAQDGKSPHRILFQVASADSMEHKMLMRQLTNTNAAAPDAVIEVVCHGPGLDLLMTDRTVVRKKITGLKELGIKFIACENAMKDRGVTREQMIEETDYVPAAIIHIVTRQEEGWSYLKAGF